MRNLCMEVLYRYTPWHSTILKEIALNLLENVNNVKEVIKSLVCNIMLQKIKGSAALFSMFITTVGRIDQLILSTHNIIVHIPTCVVGSGGGVVVYPISMGYS